MRRLDIGVAVYGAPDKLARTLTSIRETCQTDWRVWAIHNPHPNVGDRNVAEDTLRHFAETDKRIVPVWLPENVGYAGAVNELFRRAETEYIAYSDADVMHHSPGWDETMCRLLDQHHEVGMVFPNGGAYRIDRGAYYEIMWGIGCAWVINRMLLSEVGSFDQALGHQEEADWCLRVRMAGWKCASFSAVSISHDASATSNPAQIERINRGVVNWVDKWVAYFCGKNYNYHSPNVLRWEDWPPNALYLEEYWRQHLPDLNKEPEIVRLDGREYDLIKVPRLKGFYRGRII